MFERVKEFASIVYSIGISNAVKLETGRTKQLFVKNIKTPVYLRAGSSDVPTFKQIFVRSQYNVKIDSTPSFIIDGGANIGLSAVYFANRFPNAVIVAIEPDKNNFKVLQKNIVGYPNIHAINAGIWNIATDMKVVDKYNKGNWGMVTEEYTGDDKSNTIRSVTIPEIMEQFKADKIDLLKLDIETSEKQLFSDNYNDWLPLTKIILIELHDHKIAGCSKAFFTAINNTFNKYSFSQKGENTVIVNDDM